MASGTVRSFNTPKRCEPISFGDGSKDVFVHTGKLEKAGLHQLNDGQKASYKVAVNKGKTPIVHIRLQDAA